MVAVGGVSAGRRWQHQWQSPNRARRQRPLDELDEFGRDEGEFRDFRDSSRAEILEAISAEQNAWADEDGGGLIQTSSMVMHDPARLCACACAMAARPGYCSHTGREHRPWLGPLAWATAMGDGTSAWPPNRQHL